MSGPIPSAVAEAAARYAADAAGLAAMRAEASRLDELRADAERRGLTIGRTIAARFREAAEARKGREPDSLPGRTWRAMSERARIVIVMLGGSADDPQRAARQPWESFSDADKAAMGAVARELGANLRDAACLF